MLQLFKNNGASKLNSSNVTRREIMRVYKYTTHREVVLRRVVQSAEGPKLQNRFIFLLLVCLKKHILYILFL